MPRGKASTPVDPNETKSQKFVRLANIRIGAALTAIERLSNLGSSAYERTPEQVAKLEKCLNDATKDMVAALSPKSPGDKKGRDAVL